MEYSVLCTDKVEKPPWNTMENKHDKKEEAEEK